MNKQGSLIQLLEEILLIELSVSCDVGTHVAVDKSLDNSVIIDLPWDETLSIALEKLTIVFLKHILGTILLDAGILMITVSELHWHRHFSRVTIFIHLSNTCGRDHVD